MLFCPPHHLNQNPITPLSKHPVLFICDTKHNGRDLISGLLLPHPVSSQVYTVQKGHTAHKVLSVLFAAVSLVPGRVPGP